MSVAVVTHRRLRPVLVVLAAATTLTILPAVAHASVTPPPPVTGGIPLVNSIETIGPGISQRHVKALDQAGWYDARFLTVDLSNSAVSTDLLTSGPVASGGPLSVAANKAGAVAGVNGESSTSATRTRHWVPRSRTGSCSSRRISAAGSTSGSARTGSVNWWT